MPARVKLAALDTGFESRHSRSYFVRRRKRACETGHETTAYTRFPKANVLCDCGSQFILAVKTSRGPGPDDPYFRPTLTSAVRGT
jgi:hypothetical protein